MIRVKKRDAPEGFDHHVRDRGRAWLATKVDEDPDRPRAFWNDWNWSGCRAALADMFHHRCGYTACWIPSGQVEHFVSWKTSKDTKQRELAYEWSNYRWIMPQLNQRKGTKEVLDPFEVEDDWFEINLFTLHLRLTDKIPSHLRDIAQTTLKCVGIDKDPLVIAVRQEALTRFRRGTPLDEVERYSPQMGRALRRLFDAPLAALTEPEQRLRHHLKATHERKRLKAEAY